MSDARFSQRDRRRSARACLCQSDLLLPLNSAQSAAAHRQFRRHSADLLPRAGAPGPPPAGRPSTGQPSAEPKLFSLGKNETVLPRRRSGRTNILSGAEDRLSRRLALSLPLFFGLPLHPVTRPTLQKIFSLARQAAAIKPARAVLAQPLTIELFHASTLPCYSPAARPRRGAHAALCWSH